jgi:alpha,alpha-trehalase
MKSTPFYVELADLFKLGHSLALFPDGKKWADAIPNKSLTKISEAFELWNKAKDTPLYDFINTHFSFPEPMTSTFVADNTVAVDDHIKSLWPYLRRKANAVENGSSLIPLKYDYIVPGGRFNEIYYWDSYFTMIGLAEHNLVDEVENMVNNFADFLNAYGFIPNGNRQYFLSRSQPPFFAMMVDLLSKHKSGEATIEKYLPHLVIEHNYWMGLHRSVKLDDGILNRYWDDDPSPRMEMYEDDERLAFDVADRNQLFTNIRAACESGWDFSSRWFNADDLQSISTTNIIPVDLNCLLYFTEKTIAKGYEKIDTALSSKYHKLAEERKVLIEKYLFDDKTGCYGDYNYVQHQNTNKITAAMMFPLYFQIASKSNALSTINVFKNALLKEGGVATTNQHSGQQWDAPNGWAPLQWIAVMGLHNYGQLDLASKVAQSWLSLNESVFKITGKMLEKYNVFDCDKIGGGGEYPVQDGFGWTNGVYVGLKKYLSGSRI